MALPASRRTYIFVLVAVITVLLLLSGGFGESWDLASRERSALIAYTYYFRGFDATYLRANPDPDPYYGPLLDVLITLAQTITGETVKKFQIRILLQALLSLSCLIPIFLTSARVVSKPLALIAAALVAATPVFFGHAFINPKDCIFASGYVWAVYFILFCFEGRRRPSYLALISLGAFLGLVTSLRIIAIYLLLLVPLVAIVLPAFKAQVTKAFLQWHALTLHLFDQTVLQLPGLAVLLFSFGITYTLSMPAILIDLSPHAFIATIADIVSHGWDGTVLYFGDKALLSVPWHYTYGYLFVKLPLYYHFFSLIILFACMSCPRATWRAFGDFLRHAESAPTVILLITALIIPLILVSIMPSVRFDEVRHVLFIVPVICMLLYFGFIAVVKQMRRSVSVVVILAAILCWSEAVMANRSLHPYEYIYYNPLVNPVGSFELDYWATSFRELAERLNDYARSASVRGEKLRLSVCGPKWTLTHFLDPALFDVVPSPDPAFFANLPLNSYLAKKAIDLLAHDDTAPQFIVALNRGACMALVNGRPSLISINRGNLVIAVVARN
jgi:hypothetical protein